MLAKKPVADSKRILDLHSFDLFPLVTWQSALYQSALDLTVRVVEKEGVLRCKAFPWKASMVSPSVRDRSVNSEISRKWDHIAPEEIEVAISGRYAVAVRRHGETAREG